jgi:hypothetical protein
MPQHGVYLDDSEVIVDHPEVATETPNGHI